MVSQLDFELRAPPPIEHGCPCPTQRNAGPHAHRDTPSVPHREMQALMLTEIPLLRVTRARGDVDFFIHTRAATYGWAGCALHKRVWQRDWLSFPRHAGGAASICGKGHSFQTHVRVLAAC